MRRAAVRGRDGGGRGTGVVGRRTGVGRLLAALLVLALAVAGCGPWPAGSALATGSGTGGFPDVTGHWAERDVARMALKGVIQGYPDGSFKPYRSVTRLETIVMVVRALGREDEAESRSTVPASFRNPEFLPWGHGYVAVAVDQGIIAGQDLTDFRNAEMATRLDVAVFIVRALGLAVEADALAGCRLPFADGSQVPSWARGYVKLIRDEGIMKGNLQNEFQPGSAVTRAEMATLLSRLDRKLQNALDSREVGGTLTSVNSGPSPSVTITPAGGAARTLAVVPGALIYKNDQRAGLADLIIGDAATAVLNQAGYVGYLETTPPQEVVGGTITVVTTSPVARVTLQPALGAARDFYPDSGTEVTLDNRSATLADLTAGQAATVTVQAGRVAAIAATSLEQTVTGVLVAFVSGPTGLLTVDTGEDRETYSVAAGAAITKDGVAVTLADLRSGDGVTLSVRNGTVQRIVAESLNRDFSGTLVGVALQNPPLLTVATDTGEFTYPVDSRVDIERNGSEATLIDLRSGDDVEVRVRSGEVTLIEAEAVESEVSGTVKAVILSDVSQISITDEDGEVQTYDVSADAIIRRGRSRILLSEISPGNLVELRLESGLAVRIDVQAVAVLRDLRGTVEYIVEDADVVVIRLEGATSATQTREIHVGATTLIYKDDDLVELDDLDVDDRVVVFGSDASGVFRANVIVVTTVSL